MVQVYKLKGIQHYACGIRKGVGLNDVHAPAREHAGDGCKQRRPVGRQQSQRERVVPRTQFGLHWLSAQFPIQQEVRGNLRGSVHGSVAPWEALEEPFNLSLTRAAGLAAHLLEESCFVGGMQAVAVQSAAEMI